jgi:hypothetical protein
MWRLETVKSKKYNIKAIIYTDIPSLNLDKITYRYLNNKYWY